MAADESRLPESVPGSAESQERAKKLADVRAAIAETCMPEMSRLTGLSTVTGLSRTSFRKDGTPKPPQDAAARSSKPRSWIGRRTYAGGFYPFKRGELEPKARAEELDAEGEMRAEDEEEESFLRAFQDLSDREKEIRRGLVSDGSVESHGSGYRAVRRTPEGRAMLEAALERRKARGNWYWGEEAYGGLPATMDSSKMPDAPLWHSSAVRGQGKGALMCPYSVE